MFHTLAPWARALGPSSPGESLGNEGSWEGLRGGGHGKGKKDLEVQFDLVSVDGKLL